MRRNSPTSPQFALLPAGFVFSVMSAFGCEVIHGSGHLVEEERDITEFERLVIESEAVVEYVQMDERSLTIAAEDNIIDKMVTKVQNGTLVLGTSGSAILDPTLPIEVRISGPDLGQVSVRGSGSFECETLDSHSFGVDVGGSGSVRLVELAADELEVVVSGSGSVSIDELEGEEVALDIPGSGGIGIGGRADTQTIRIAGSGSYLGLQLESDDVAVELDGSGDVEVFARRSLNVSLSGSGDVRFKGDPVVSSLIAGDGTVTPLD